jgi:hypothetical protein
MQNERIPDPGEMIGEIQRLVLFMLLARTSGGLCLLDELSRAVGDVEVARLAVEDLHAAGLVHRLDRVVFASGPAVRFYELELAAVRLLADEASLQTGDPEAASGRAGACAERIGGSSHAGPG